VGPGVGGTLAASSVMDPACRSDVDGRANLGQELVEAQDEVLVSLEDGLYTLDDPLGVDPARREQRRQVRGWER